MFVPKIESNLKRLNSLIVDILDLSKLGESEIEKAWVNLGEIIDEAKANVFHMIEDSRANIYVDNVFDIYCSRTQIVLVFQNLLDNAIKYKQKGKPVEIIISSRIENDSFYCEVKDNGIGMSEENMERIFEPFLRLHTNQEYPGTGLGLSICRKIIVNHGGSIGVSSRLGEGTVFNFWFPIA